MHCAKAVFKFFPPYWYSDKCNTEVVGNPFASGLLVLFVELFFAACCSVSMSVIEELAGNLQSQHMVFRISHVSPQALPK